MTTAGWVQFAVLIALVAGATPLLGSYLAKVFGGEAAPGDRLFRPVERVVYRIAGVDPEREQRWNVYAYSLLAFSAVSVLLLYLLQRFQGFLPANPYGFDGVKPSIAFNTATSFTSNTNWQAYSGESTMSHFTQMAGLAVQNFVSAAVGIAVAVALVRGLVRRGSRTIGNFWVDLTRATVRVLLPIAFVAAMILVSQGVIQNFQGFTPATVVDSTTGVVDQLIPGGPIASQEAIKDLGTNGGGFLNANSAHPFENPNAFTNLFEIFLLLVIPFSLTYMFGKMARDQKQGWVVFAAMFAVWLAASVTVMTLETNGNPQLDARGADQTATSELVGGNLEGKEVRLGAAACGVFASSTTGTSTGSVNCSHDSLTPGGGGVTLANIMLGEVSPGGVGSGLYGMLVFVLLAVFIAGLMVGRTPEYLGKKIQAGEVKLVVLYLLVVPLAILVFAGISVVLKTANSQILNPGAHGFSEILYAFTSGANNNGSAFGGITVTSDWYTTTIGIAMLVGRLLLMVPVLAIAGSLVRKPHVPESAGTFPTGTPLFAVLLVGVVLIVVGLTYFPALALGPIVEQLGI